MDPPQPMTAYQGPDPEPGNVEKSPQGTPTTLEDPESVTVTQRLKRFLYQRGNLSNILARAFIWIIQAGFLVLPTSFPSVIAFILDASPTEDPLIVQTNRNIGIFVLGIVSCVVGGIGLLCLSLCHSHNHAWILDSIFIPGTLSGLSGLISTFVNIYGSGHYPSYGATTVITLVVTGGCTVIFGSLTLNHTYRQRQLTHMDPPQPITAYQSLTQGPDPEPGNQEKSPQGTPTTLEDPESVTVTQRLKRFLYQRGNLVRAFMWIVQAGFLVLPTSFPSVFKIIQSSTIEVINVETNRNIEIFALGIVCCIVGGIGLLRLGLYHSHDHAWLLNSIFAPGTFNGLSGLISTFVNIYGSGHGVRYGTTTTITIVITSGFAVFCGSLTVRYYKKNSAIRHHEHENAGGK